MAAEEHPEFWGGLIDLDPASDAAEALLDQVLRPDAEDQVAFRQGQRYVLRLIRAQPEAFVPAFRCAPEASYLITGAAGSLGAVMAEWLVAHGAQHLVLWSRRAITLPQWPGAAVTTAALDVSDEAQVRAFLLEYSGPPIRGVIHLAGVTQDQLIQRLEAEALRASLRPKMRGSWLLHDSLELLDFFVTFSSVGAILGQPGQASYAAANAFMDALAHDRQQQGKAALSINWGVWSGLGLAETPGGQQLDRHLHQFGIQSLSLKQNLDALEIALQQDQAQLAVLNADWSAYRPLRLLAGLVESVNAPSPLPLVDAAVEDRLSWIEMLIRGQSAALLNTTPEAIPTDIPLADLGLNSLMGLQLRNKLETALGLSLSATLIYSYPTAAALAAHLLGRLDESPAPAEDSLSGWDSERLTTLMDEVEELTDDEVMKLLKKGTQP